MKKRTAKVFAMAIASLFVLSACSGTASNQTSTGETAGAAGATDTTVASSTGQSSGGNHFYVCYRYGAPYHGYPFDE